MLNRGAGRWAMCKPFDRFPGPLEPELEREVGFRSGGRADLIGRFPNEEAPDLAQMDFPI